MLYESMATVLPFVKEFVVMDIGSTDGTKETLLGIVNANPKVKLLTRPEWPKIDANVFATLANELVEYCQYDNVWYLQADEIWHEKLLRLTNEKLKQGIFDLAFWRIQYRENFQIIKWFPHIVHRIGNKSNFNFVGDGMNSDRYLEPPICSNYGGEYFLRWGEMGQEGIKGYEDEMILDVSLVGGFRDNIVRRRELHSPFWHESNDIEGMNRQAWMNREYKNDNWIKTDSPYMVPNIMKYHLGKTTYEIRPELIEDIKNDDTLKWLNY